METQLKFAAEKSKTDIVYDIIKSEQRRGRIEMTKLENLLVMAGIAPNWRKFYLRELAGEWKISCDGAFVYILSQKAISHSDIGL